MTVTVSTYNSSPMYIPLTGGTTYTGAGESVSAYSLLTVRLRGDVTVPGTLYLGFSSTLGGTYTETAVPVPDPQVIPAISVNVTAPYFRVRYTNGAFSQNTFRIQTAYSVTTPQGPQGFPGPPGPPGPSGGGGGGSVNPIRETFTLTPSNISAKTLTLSSAPIDPSQSFCFIPMHGVEQRYGVDFTVSGSIVSWAGLGLDGFLESGDVIVVTYFI